MRHRCVHEVGSPASSRRGSRRPLAAAEPTPKPRRHQAVPRPARSCSRTPTAAPTSCSGASEDPQVFYGTGRRRLYEQVVDRRGRATATALERLGLGAARSPKLAAGQSIERKADGTFQKHCGGKDDAGADPGHRRQGQGDPRQGRVPDDGDDPPAAPARARRQRRVLLRRRDSRRVRRQGLSRVRRQEGRDEADAADRRRERQRRRRVRDEERRPPPGPRHRRDRRARR